MYIWIPNRKKEERKNVKNMIKKNRFKVNSYMLSWRYLKIHQLKIQMQFVCDILLSWSRPQRLIMVVSHFRFVRACRDLQLYYKHSRLSRALDIFTLISKRNERRNDFAKSNCTAQPNFLYNSRGVHFY